MSMLIFTKQEFESLADKKNNVFDSSNSQFRAFSRYSATTSVFLSHSHYDKELVYKAKAFFENMGISIYVDWADSTMPEKPSSETAIKIKSQIHDNDKFILLATNLAVASRWCNWEVGIGDIYKSFNDKICILPLANNSRDWQGNEYLQIYPHIEPIKTDCNSYLENLFKVVYPDGRSCFLHDWIIK